MEIEWMQSITVYLGGRRASNIDSVLSGKLQAVEMMQWTGADRKLEHLLSLARHFQITSIDIEVFRVHPWFISPILH